MAVNSEYDVSSKRCIDYANELIELCGLSFPSITSIKNINSDFFVDLFETTTGHAVPDLLLSNDPTTEAHNIQAVIDTLSLDVLGLSLSHITGEDVVSGNVVCTYHLLEVFESLILHLSAKTEDDKAGKPVKESSQSVSGENEENMYPMRVLKRKTCRKTLRKPYSNIHSPKRKMSESTQVSSHSKRTSDTVDNGKSPVKRKISKTASRVKQPLIEACLEEEQTLKNVEDLYNLNFKTCVKALLQSDKSPVIRAQQLRTKYIQSLKRPVKKKAFPPCEKSFLLPHNLRPKTKSPIRQCHTRTRIAKKNIKSPVSANIRSHENGVQVPAIFQLMLNEFPGFKFSNNTRDFLTSQYYNHVSSMHKQLKSALLKKPSIVVQTEKAMEREAKLSKILEKDLQEKKHWRELQEHKDMESKVKSTFRDARLQSVRLRQYFDEFHNSMSRKLRKRNFSEEVLVEKTFKEMLDLQKEQVRLLCKRMKETDQLDAQQHRQYLIALENLYKEQMDLLAESVNAEMGELHDREKAQKLASEKLNQEIVKNLQNEVRSLQKNVLEMIEDIHFRELDAQNFIQSFQQENT